MSTSHSVSFSFGFVAFTTGVAAIGGFLFGYDTAVINGANSYLKVHFASNSAQEGLAGASAILGCIPGAMTAGFLSDRVGRRKLLFLCAKRPWGEVRVRNWATALRSFSVSGY